MEPATREEVAAFERGFLTMALDGLLDGTELGDEPLIRILQALQKSFVTQDTNRPSTRCRSLAFSCIQEAEDWLLRDLREMT